MMLLKSIFFITSLVGLSQAVLQLPGFFRSNPIENATARSEASQLAVPALNTTKLMNTMNISNEESKILINPKNIQLSIRGVPKEVGDKILDEVRLHIGEEMLTLEQLRQRIEPLKTNASATLVNKTVISEVNESFVTNKTSRMLPMLNVHSPPAMSYVSRTQPQQHQQYQQPQQYQQQQQQQYQKPQQYQQQPQQYQQQQQPQRYQQQQQQYQPKPQKESNYSPEPVQNNYVPQDYYYHPEPQPKYEAPKYQQPEKPKYTENKPQYNVKQQEYSPQPQYQKAPECKPTYQAPKIVYRYIEVCSHPQYKKEEKNYKPVASVAPKTVIKKASSKGYTESYSTNNAPKSNYQPIAQQYPKPTSQQAYQQGNKMAADADEQFAKIRKELTEKLTELNRLKKEMEDTFGKKQSFPGMKQYQMPTMPSIPSFEYAPYEQNPQYNIPKMPSYEPMPYTIPVMKEPESYQKPTYNQNNDDDIKLSYSKETETFQQ